MKFFNNTILDSIKINGFTKEELLEIKTVLTKLASEKKTQSEIDEYLKSKIPGEISEFFLTYINELKSFLNQYLFSSENLQLNISFNYYHLKGAILEELRKISGHLINLKLNAQNTKRFLKSSNYLDDVMAKIQNLLNDYEGIYSKLEASIKPEKEIFNDYRYIWIEKNKISNICFKVNSFSEELLKWEEISSLYEYIKDLEANSAKRTFRKKKKENVVSGFFEEVYQFYNKKQDGLINIYSDLIALLFQRRFLEAYEEDVKDIDEYVNVLEKKEISQKIKKIIQPILRELIKEKLKKVFEEIQELDKISKAGDDKAKINLITLLEQKFSISLPNIADYYLNVLEKKYSSTIADLKDYDEFKTISKFYSEKIGIFYNIMEEMDKYLTYYQLIVRPHEEILNSYKKIILNVCEEITRRRDEYLSYLKTIRSERLRDSIRNYIYTKISEMNELMNKYQDETSMIVREELPQLKHVRSIINDYKTHIQKIKNEVYQKLNEFKEKDIDIYQIIKQWEDNFTKKRQQLSFLFSLLLNKLFKNFKDLIEEEELLFDHLKEISLQEDNVDNIPLNFALSTYLVDKLTEDELNERIIEIKHKIEGLSKDLDLYRNELTNLEITLKNKVKLREGIDTDKVICGVCHKNINLGKEQLIKCPFCGAIYHYLCVAFWLSKYNSCPSCQNVFLDPNAGIYENQE